MSQETVRHISLQVLRPPDEVYRFAANPENLPRWARGLATGVRRQGDEWIAESPMGTVKVRMAEQNAFGVVDHDVTLPSGDTVHNPMRVVPRDGGSEVTFTLFRRAGVSDEEFAADARAVADDLRALKELLER